MGSTQRTVPIRKQLCQDVEETPTLPESAPPEWTLLFLTSTAIESGDSESPKGVGGGEEEEESNLRVFAM